MSVKRAMPMLLALGILLLNGGDCISPLFADQQSKDCCARGQCHRSQKKDPCCQTTPPTLTQYFQPAARVTLNAVPVAVANAPNDRAAFTPSFATFNREYVDLALQWPPGAARGFALPLLV